MSSRRAALRAVQVLLLREESQALAPWHPSALHAACRLMMISSSGSCPLASPGASPLREQQASTAASPAAAGKDEEERQRRWDEEDENERLIIGPDAQGGDLEEVPKWYLIVYSAGGGARQLRVLVPCARQASLAWPPLPP